ncbi:MAG: 4a-hydroxytetrahydrobiopterin dehydratase [Candidatus Eremiobacteraeota bacterium]|nr:4a-hydroxytetrahydrobiopterin dehydratase [Candidatus Eremiobacteraeota bacterium]
MYPLVGGAIPEEQLPSMMENLPGWNLKRVDGLPRLEREIGFANFQEAMSFSNQVAEFAEVQGHHPTLLTEWGKVTVGWWTHDVGGVHANDFTSAQRTNALLNR